MAPTLATAQKITGTLEIAAILAVATCAALVLLHMRADTTPFPGLGTLSNQAAFIMLGASGGLIILNTITLIVHLVRRNNQLIEEGAKPPLRPLPVLLL